MKSRILWDGKFDLLDGLLASGVTNLAWFLMTILIHDLLKRALGLPADAGHRDGAEDVMAAVMLPLILPIAPVVVAALFAIERNWRRGAIVRARLGYFALSLALLLWCWWSLQTSLSYGFQNRFHGYRISDTVQAAAYASLGFPLVVACACFLLAILRRTSPSV